MSLCINGVRPLGFRRSKREVGLVTAWREIVIEGSCLIWPSQRPAVIKHVAHSTDQPVFCGRGAACYRRGAATHTRMRADVGRRPDGHSVPVTIVLQRFIFCRISCGRFVPHLGSKKSGLTHGAVLRTLRVTVVAEGLLRSAMQGCPAGWTGAGHRLAVPVGLAIAGATDIIDPCTITAEHGFISTCDVSRAT